MSSIYATSNLPDTIPSSSSSLLLSQSSPSSPLSSSPSPSQSSLSPLSQSSPSSIHSSVSSSSYRSSTSYHPSTSYRSLSPQVFTTLPRNFNLINMN